MPRTEQFDRADVVRRARDLFWRVGFEGASVPAIETATGLSRSSVYNAFGSKRGLFDAAVQSYLDEVIRPRLRPLRAKPVAAGALTDYLDALAAAFADPDSLPSSSGCLLVNTAGSAVATDVAVAQVIADYRSELRGAIGRGVDAHAPQADAATRQRIADAVTGLVVASFALARVDPGAAGDSIRTARALLG